MYKQQGLPTFYIVSGYIDFRCGIDSLCYKLKQIDSSINPLSNSSFIFSNKHRDKLKILYWGDSGFWLLQHRLEENKYKWLKNNENSLENVSLKQLEWLLEGLDINPKSLHKEMKNKQIF